VAGGIDPTELARYIWAVIYGMAVQAAAGATRAELKAVTRVALGAWPDPADTAYSTGTTGRAAARVLEKRQ